MYISLYRKWRPLTFSEVVGQNHITTTLKNQIKMNKTSHAYVFTGTRGTGKTTCAKILARAINCENPQNGDPCNECTSCKGILLDSVTDVVEIDAASNNGVDNIRDVRDEVRYTPVNVKKRVYIIDEVHMLSQGAFNALLKTLEEPPGHVLFILATTEIHKVPATVLSRCQRFDFKRIAIHEIERRLLEISESENIKLLDSGALKIARLCDGGMRDALSILERVSIGSQDVDEKYVSDAVGILSDTEIIKLSECIIDENTTDALNILRELYLSGKEISSVFEQVLSVFRDILLAKTAKTDISAVISPMYSVSFLKELSQKISGKRLIMICEIIIKSINSMQRAMDKNIEADMCIIKICSEFDMPVQTVAETVKKQEKAKIPVETLPKAPKKELKIEYSEEEWAKILKKLTGRINIAALTNLKISSKMNISKNVITVVADDYITASLANENNVKDEILKCINEEFEGTYKLQIIEKEKITEDTFKNIGVDKILENAKKLNIELEEI